MNELQANIRKSKEIKRSEGRIPAVLYGHGIDNILLDVDYKNFVKVFREAGSSTIIALKFDNQMRNVLIYDYTQDPVDSKITHIDFYQVKMDEKITVEVSLVFVGESLAVKDLGGSMVYNFREVEVEALPGDLPHEITIDVSNLATFDDYIHIKDIILPKGVKILAEPDEIVVLVSPPRSEEELAGLQEKPVENVEAIEVAKAKKVEEEDGEDAKEGGK